MTTAPHGLYREQDAIGAPARVYVSYGDHAALVQADRYVAEEMSPPFDMLPTREEYFGAASPAPKA